MAVTFTRQPTRDDEIFFYCGDCAEPPAPQCPYRVGRPYFLLTAGKKAKDPLTLKQIWDNAGRYAGVFIFVGEPIEDIDDFVVAVRDFVAGWSGTNPRILWFSDPRLDPLDGSVLGITPSGVTTGPDTFSLRNISLTVDNSLEASLFDEDGIQIKPTDEHRVFLQAEADGVEYDVPGGVIVPMCGEGSGTFQFRIDFERSVLFNFGGDVRYFSPGADPEALISRRYPVFDLGTQAAAIPFDGQLDPLRADTKTGTRTRFSFGDLPKERAYEAYFRTNTGRQVLLTPRPEARLMLASFSIPPEDGVAEGYYLTPAGPFRLDFEANAPGATAGSAAERLMTGSLGTEFVRADAGDTLEFVPDQAAYAPVFPLVKGGIEASLLDPKLRTSWVTVRPAAENNDFGYYSQPESAAYYGQGDGAGNLFLDALGVRISAIEGAAFPGVPYTGVKTSPNGGGDTINPGIDLAAFEDFERQILNPSRRLAVPRNPNGPVFVADSPARAAASGARQGFVVRTEDDKPTGLTPQGLVAELNDGSGEAAEGTWNTLILAKDASGKGRDLTFAPPEGDPTLAQPLADALMRNDLFLVISRDKTVPWTDGEEVSNIGIFQSQATIGDFTLNLAPASQAGVTAGVVLFKFRTDKSVLDLAADVQSWTEPRNFNDEDPDGFPIQRYLVDYLNANGDPRLAHFKKVVNSPGWTGILVLNFGIGGDDLPFQMQGLVGGLREPLQGHHFGIETSQIDPTTATIEESSLFGLIQYPPITPSRKSLQRIEPLELPATYSVEELAVVFANSAIDDFSCRVHLTINELFGRAVELRDRDPKLPDNTFEILGTYQDHGGQSTFTFTCEDDNLFATVVEPDTAVARVLSRVSITQAEFVTLSAEKQDDKTEIAARFTLQGGLAFNPDALALDLFSFGAEEAGGDDLAFTNTALDVSFAIPRESNENLLLVFNPSEMTFDVGRKPTPRAGSLVASLPLTLSGFKYSEEGLTKSDLGASPVGSPQLLNDADETPTYAEYPASLPKYALDFVLPMGTLGALSSVGVSFDARLMLAWGESETVPENDAAALFVQLPAVTPGIKGMSLQGVISVGYGDATLAKLATKTAQGGELEAYTILFNNVALKLVGFTLPPGVMLDFILFAPPTAKDPSLGNLGWYLAYNNEEKTA